MTPFSKYFFSYVTNGWQMDPPPANVTNVKILLKSSLRHLTLLNACSGSNFMNIFSLVQILWGEGG